ncbi:MAG TPA: UbiA family prenyltransferase [Gemmataceae bacterium]|nr:UbiA family prenyltransferase [Gemmataceae bacterium]
MQKQLASSFPRLPASAQTYAQLVRLPNVFTAFADIGLAWFAAQATGTPASRWPSFLLLMLASGCLYCAGMVWNDFFDIEQDTRERPFRPLPSGRVTRKAAAYLGSALMATGLLLSAIAGWLGKGSPRQPLMLAIALVAAIFLYDAWLKRTRLGPIGMGTCRSLNVLLGLSVAEETLGGSARLGLALVIGVYIVGVTWFARTEARTSNQASLTAAAFVMLAALVLALAVPAWLDTGNCSILFPYLLLALGFWIGIPASRAANRPTPAYVQAAVKRAILGLVVLDAALASSLVGAVGLILLVLLLPTMYLGRWIYST